ncbi:DExH-box ATP-dependent RNA helicase DExH5, mitochondrial-like isoform X2 [Magnolia sinica]|uniref:DExH-box ATP-dependent RNA helicase DExH5, mitochondrial-like isoform X2 n=1 Tax=Magnolia sinica TaxID=86752 RepID=UPI00265AE089|nr:DExH-box ATP-dependent RNA helicase DExH5, mitochondrial-like isoform X2 [Magnolia sinica]
MSLSPTVLKYTLSPNPRNPRNSLSSSPKTATAMKDLPARHGSYCVPQRRLSSVVVAASSAAAVPSTGGASPTRSVDFDWPDQRDGPASEPRNDPYPMLLDQQSLQYSRWGSDGYSDDDSDHEMEPSMSKGASTLENVDEWKWKLNVLIRKNDEQEIVSRERKDRRDFDNLAALATKMGLYSHHYGRVVVISKVPLPNYRSDLDEKRPQREVSIPASLYRRVDDLLEEHLSRRPLNRESLPDATFSRSSSNGSIGADEGLFEPPEPYSVVMEKLQRRKSLQLRDQQIDWQESPEGQKMQEFRRSLPSYKERGALLTAISQNQVVVISGETGCGKTTQIPQYILESEIEAVRGAVCSIICTQPRRISAMAVSERVAAERGEKLGESVGYKVRLEGVKGRDTRLLFCTTGVLLRRLLVDRNLKGVTHVIVDEIHERGMNEDFLLIVLKELLPRRPELRLVLMSATLNAELFSSYFGGAPMIHIQGFTYPVQTHFLEDVLEITGYRLTPYNQTDDYGQEKSWKMQKQALRKRKSQIASVVEDALEAADLKGYKQNTRESLSCWNPDSIGFNLIEDVLCHICKQERPGAILVFMTGWDDISALKDQLQANPLLGDPRKVLLLACHGSMASSEQRLIFDKPEDGVRKIVLATNIAETSITINDVVFVIDCGKAKETSYDALNNTPCLLPSWISKASARQRQGRAGRVRAGECYRLYPRCVYDAFAEFQLPELLRTPLQSLCLQIKSLQLGSISEFLSRALQSPEPLSVQNAVEYLKIIGALDEKENLTVLGRLLSTLPVEPKLGKMLILGAIFNCLDPVLTVVSGLSVRDPFLMPLDKKDLAESAKSQFSAQDYSDHLALVRAYEGWKEAEREQNGYDFCWKNFLSLQTLKAMDSLRKQFLTLLADTGLVDDFSGTHNMWSHDEHLIRAIICAGLYPGISSVVKKEKPISLKTMEDGQVMLCSNSVNAREQRIPYPWLVFNEKVKVNSVFLRDSTGVSDSVLLLFGGGISRGAFDGHLKMLGGYLEFFMRPAVADMYLKLKRELEEIIQNKLLNPKMDIHVNEQLLSAMRLLVSEDPCDGRFVFGRQVLINRQVRSRPELNRPELGQPELRPMKPFVKFSKNGDGSGDGPGGDNSKSQLQTLLTRAGHETPRYNTKQLMNNQFRTTVEFNGMQFIGQPCHNKKLAEKDAASAALQWLTGGTTPRHEDIDNMSMMLKKSKNKQHRRF